jgi:NAD(P)-dependent dehydrogenase (short-subunit alcohol dehydrogenase family)
LEKHAGKVALCIGAASGIGARTAARLAAGGAKVVIGDINLAGAEATARAIRESGGEAVAQPCDISDEGQVNDFVRAALERHGGVDLAHLNAADVETGKKDNDLLAADMAIFDRTIAVNLRGNLLCTRAIVPQMLRRGRGAIVYTSSDGAFTTGQSLYFYRMSKAGLNSLMRSVASRWGSEGVRANVASPGFILMDEGEHMMDQAFQAAHLAATPSPRLGRSHDVAALAEFLLSDDAEWINGQVVSVNGGYLMRG